MTDVPAFVRNGRLDVLAANTLGRALYAPAFAVPGRDVNLARFRFLDPAARDFYPDFAESARTTVELLRTEAGRDPFNTSLTALIGELSTRSEEFRTMWADHDVRLHRSGRKRFCHPAGCSPAGPQPARPTTSRRHPRPADRQTPGGASAGHGQ